MKILIAPDSFKECLSASEVAKNIAAGIVRIFPDTQITSIPIADGGEGTVEAIVAATNGKIIPTRSVDALMRPIKSFYGITGDGNTAVIEMSAASGLHLLVANERNPLITSTFGTGILLKTVLESGINNIILGIGGSATNDAGVGMARAMGYRFLDRAGKEIGEGGGNLNKLEFIDEKNVHPLLNTAKIRVACDVTNPLYGRNGASVVYGPQKGATPEMIKVLDNNLIHFSGIVRKQLGVDIVGISGGGAAGGLGAGLLVFANASLKAGFDIIKEITNLEVQIQQSDLVFTAEGKIDYQTQFGKTPMGVAQIASRYKVPVIVLTGIIGTGAEIMYSLGISSIFAISDGPMTIEESYKKADLLIQNTVERIMRLWLKIV